MFNAMSWFDFALAVNQRHLPLQLPRWREQLWSRNEGLSLFLFVMGQVVYQCWLKTRRMYLCTYVCIIILLKTLPGGFLMCNRFVIVYYGEWGRVKGSDHHGAESFIYSEWPPAPSTGTLLNILNITDVNRFSLVDYFWGVEVSRSSKYASCYTAGYCVIWCSARCDMNRWPGVQWQISRSHLNAEDSFVAVCDDILLFGGSGNVQSLQTERKESILLE